jgi:hypothetical protein
MMKKIVNLLLNILTGWVAGILTLLVLSSVWRNVFPVVDRSGEGPYLPYVLLLLALMVSPFSALGGFIGGRLSREGGRQEQLIYAAVFGLFLTVPVGIFLLWYTAF